MNESTNRINLSVTKNVEVGKGVDVESHANLYRRQRGGMQQWLRTNFKLSMDQWVKIKVL